MKAIISILMLLVGAAGAFELGDVNHDNAVDCTDADLVLAFVASHDSTLLDVTLADVSKNGTVTSYDAALIMQMAGGCGTGTITAIAKSTRLQTFADVKRVLLK